MNADVSAVYTRSGGLDREAEAVAMLPWLLWWSLVVAAVLVVDERYSRGRIPP